MARAPFNTSAFNQLNHLTGRDRQDGRDIEAFEQHQDDILAFYNSLPDSYEEGLYFKTAMRVNDVEDGGINEDKRVNTIKLDILYNKYERAIAQDFVFAITPIDVHHMIENALEFNIFVYFKNVYDADEQSLRPLAEVLKRVPTDNIDFRYPDAPILPDYADKVETGVYRFEDFPPDAIEMAKVMIDQGYTWDEAFQSYVDKSYSMDRKPYRPEELKQAIEDYQALHRQKRQFETAAKDALRIKRQAAGIKIKKKPRLG